MVSCCGPGGRRLRGGDLLRQEELELLVGKGAQLGAEHIVDSDMISIATAAGVSRQSLERRSAGVAVKPHSRQVGHGQRGIGVEVVRLDEALKQIPTHLGRFIGARQKKGGREDVEAAAERCRGIKWGTHLAGFSSGPAEISATV